MDNLVAPMGFMVLNKISSVSPHHGKAYSIQSGYVTDIFAGDPVQLSGTGRDIIIAPAGSEDIRGVFAGCKYETADGRHIEWSHWPANTLVKNVEAYVYDDPDTIYSIQCTALLEADVGALCNFVPGAGNVATRRSGYIATGAAGGTSLKILGLSSSFHPRGALGPPIVPQALGPSEYGPNAWADVQIRGHDLARGTGV